MLNTILLSGHDLKILSCMLLFLVTKTSCLAAGYLKLNPSTESFMIETNKSLASYKIPSIFWNVVVQNYIHHSRPQPTTVPALNQVNLVHAVSSSFFKICFNIISPSACWFCKQALFSFFFSEPPCVFCYYCMHVTCPLIL